MYAGPQLKLLSFSHSTSSNSATLKFAGQAGEPLDVHNEPQPKVIPDFESNGAMWASIDEIKAAPRRVFRGRDTIEIFAAFDSNLKGETRTPRMSSISVVLKSGHPLCCHCVVIAARCPTFGRFYPSTATSRSAQVRQGGCAKGDGKV